MPNVILTSFASKTHAMAFAKKLIKEKLAACCTLIGGATSIYNWKGKTQSASEVLLLIKTTAAKINKMEKFFGEHHPYELPEFLTLNVSASKKFGEWINKETT